MNTLSFPVYPYGTSLLSLFGFKTNETLYKDGVNSTLSVKELISQFSVSPMVDDLEKMQRTLTPSRVKRLLAYLQRGKHVLPSVTAIVNRATFEPVVFPMASNQPLGTQSLVHVQIDQDAERMLVDGQNRLTSFGTMAKVLEERAANNDMFAQDALDELLTLTIDVKIIVTNTNTMSEASSLVRQVFADYHKNVTKPTKSIGLFFDQSSGLSNVLLGAYEDLRANTETAAFSRLFSLEGQKDALWDLAQLSTAFQRMTDMGESVLNQAYTEDADLDQGMLKSVHKRIAIGVLKHVATIPAIQLAIEYPERRKQIRNDFLCCTAIGLESFGIVAHRLLTEEIEAAAESGTSMTLDKAFLPLARLKDIDFSRNNAIWQGVVISPNDTIIKGSATAMANLVESLLKDY